MRIIITAGILSLLLPSTAIGQECYTASIQNPAPFLGNDDEIIRLSDGSIWEIKYGYNYMYAYYPEVIACPSRRKIIVNGKNLNAYPINASNKVSANTGKQQKQTVIETRIDGDFEGWDGETIFKMTNGQIWKQANFSYIYHYSYMPEVIIFQSGRGYEMQVDGVESRIVVERLR